MMAKEKKKVPNLRFKGFTDDWEQRKFFDNIEKVIDFRGRTPKKLGMEWSAEGYTALSALNVKDGYIDFTADVHYANQDLYDKWMVGNDLYKGQVLFTTEAPMGNVAQVPDNRKYVLSQRTIAFNVDKTKVTNDFLAVLLRSQNVQHTLKSLASGGTAQGVSQKSLSQLKVIVPINPKEQQKIGYFFKQLDSLIALHQRKLDLLNQLKNGFLQKMFADKDSKRPILRFEGFTGNWEIRQLKELGEIITGNTPKTSQVENYSSNGIPWVTPTDINSVYTTDSAKRLSTVGKDKAKIAPANSLLVTCIASIGKNTLILQESAFNQQINALIPVKNDPFFLLAESAKWSRIMLNLAGQTSMQIINKKTFSGISTSIPDLKEQKIIGSLFKKLDNTIAFQQQRISRVNEIKKSLLQQMFI